MHELDRLTWQKISELVILLWVEYVWKKKVNLADDPSRGESPIVEGARVGDTSLCTAFAKCWGKEYDTEQEFFGRLNKTQAGPSQLSR